MKKVLIVFIALLCCRSIFAQQGAVYSNGINGVGLGGVMASLKDGDAIFANSAGIASSSKSIVTLNYVDTYISNQIHRIGIGYKTNFGQSHFSIGLHQYGIPEYKENSFFIGYARNLMPNFRLGVNFNYNNLTIQEFNSISQTGVNLGFQADINSQIMVSGSFNNLLKIPTENYESAELIALGLQYSPSKIVSIYSEFHKKSEQPMSIILGCRYVPIPKFELQIGSDIIKSEVGFSLGYKHQSVLFRVGYSNHQYIGGSYGFSGQYIR
jgi:hypothetical protein